MSQFEYLSDRFSYDPLTGGVWWKDRPREQFNTEKGWRIFQTKHAGKPCGNLQPTGYFAVRVGGQLWLIHRIAWVLGNGTFIPDGFVIDHINHNPQDNRLSNLRIASRSQNGFNSVTKRILPKGVYFDRARKTYQAHVTANGKRVTRRFTSLDDATTFVRTKRAELHGDFANHGDRNAS